MSAKENIGEQLSAYLDGELSAAETERIRQAAAADDALRGELAELAAVRKLLRAMPPERAPEDLAGRVLAEAERSVLVGPSHAERPAGLLRWVRLAATAAVLLVAGGVGMTIALTLWSPPRASYEHTVVRGPAEPARHAGDGRHDAAPTRRYADRALGDAIAERRRDLLTEGNVARDGELGMALKDSRDADRLAAIHDKAGPEGAKVLSKPAGQPEPENNVEETTAALAGDNNEIIFTDRLDYTQRQIEQLLVTNGIAPVAAQAKSVESYGYAAKGGDRLGRGNYYNQLRMAPRQVQYEAFVTPEQMNKVQEEIRNLRGRQRVSQAFAFAAGSAREDHERREKGADQKDLKEQEQGKRMGGEIARLAGDGKRDEPGGAGGPAPKRPAPSVHPEAVAAPEAPAPTTPAPAPAPAVQPPPPPAPAVQPSSVSRPPAVAVAGRPHPEPESSKAAPPDHPARGGRPEGPGEKGDGGKIDVAAGVAATTLPPREVPAAPATPATRAAEGKVEAAPAGPEKAELRSPLVAGAKPGTELSSGIAPQSQPKRLSGPADVQVQQELAPTVAAAPEPPRPVASSPAGGSAHGDVRADAYKLRAGVGQPTGAARRMPEPAEVRPGGERTAVAGRFPAAGRSHVEVPLRPASAPVTEPSPERVVARVSVVGPHTSVEQTDSATKAKLGADSPGPAAVDTAEALGERGGRRIGTGPARSAAGAVASGNLAATPAPAEGEVLARQGDIGQVRVGQETQAIPAATAVQGGGSGQGRVQSGVAGQQIAASQLGQQFMRRYGQQQGSPATQQATARLQRLVITLNLRATGEEGAETRTLMKIHGEEATKEAKDARDAKAAAKDAPASR